jgi:hypothetical protein
VKIAIPDQLTKMRSEAAVALRRRFNALAHDNLHDDMVALVAGDHSKHPVHARERRLAELRDLLARASCPEEIKAALVAAGVTSE